jgi:hypothetical protein
MDEPLTVAAERSTILIREREREKKERKVKYILLMIIHTRDSFQEKKNSKGYLLPHLVRGGNGCPQSCAM